MGACDVVCIIQIPRENLYKSGPDFGEQEVIAFAREQEEAPVRSSTVSPVGFCHGARGIDGSDGDLLVRYSSC